MIRPSAPSLKPALLSPAPRRYHDRAGPGRSHTMPPLAELEEIIRRNEPLAPYTHLRLGGPAEMLIQPRSLEELSRVVRLCSQQKIPLRVLGSGCNMMVRDEGARGAILRLAE